MSAPRLITYQGRTATLTEWASSFGRTTEGLKYRLKRMPLEKAMVMMVRSPGKSISNVTRDREGGTRYVTRDGIRKPLVAWARIIRVQPETLARRLAVLSVADALNLAIKTPRRATR